MAPKTDAKTAKVQGTGKETKESPKTSLRGSASSARPDVVRERKSSEKKTEKSTEKSVATATKTAARKPKSRKKETPAKEQRRSQKL